MLLGMRMPIQMKACRLTLPQEWSSSSSRHSAICFEVTPPTKLLRRRAILTTPKQMPLGAEPKLFNIRSNHQWV
ncbi:MAG: hypothetical protein WCG85_28560, partial [Polyangia bacterium]